jgi:hypothetical protein
MRRCSASTCAESCACRSAWARVSAAWRASSARRASSALRVSSARRVSSALRASSAATRFRRLAGLFGARARPCGPPRPSGSPRLSGPLPRGALPASGEPLPRAWLLGLPKGFHRRASSALLASSAASPLRRRRAPPHASPVRPVALPRRDWRLRGAQRPLAHRTACTGSRDAAGAALARPSSVPAGPPPAPRSGPHA